MQNLDRSAILRGAEEAFYKAMIDGYAAAESKTSSKMTTNGGCTKSITFQYGGYTVIDTWHTNPGSNRSTGSTLITHAGMPVWSMCYGGWYPDNVIEFLKESLMISYGTSKFTGCRGRQIHERWVEGVDSHWLTYSNVWSGSFENFHGNEFIYSRHAGANTNNTIGQHQYFGYALI